MNAEKIRELWRIREKGKAAALEKWDDLAPEFAAIEMPTVENSPFMALVAREEMLPPDGAALDIGCGAGRFALAFAGGCRHVTGTDLSPKMIACGKEKAKELQIKNVDFFAADWHDFDLAAAGFGQRFDFVFAHMSPAIQSAETLEKMIQASKGWCALVKPARHRGRVADGIRSLLAEEEPDRGKSDFLYAVALLWADGYLPYLHYWEQKRVHRRTPEEALAHYRRHRGEDGMDTEKEKTIKEYLQSIAVDGIIEDETEMLFAAVYWQAKKGAWKHE